MRANFQAPPGCGTLRLWSQRLEVGYREDAVRHDADLPLCCGDHRARQGTRETNPFPVDRLGSRAVGANCTLRVVHRSAGAELAPRVARGLLLRRQLSPVHRRGWRESVWHTPRSRGRR